MTTKFTRPAKAAKVARVTSPDKALATLLADRAAARASGILTAVRGRLRRVFCLTEGQLAYAASNVIEEQFGAALVHDGVLAVECAREAELLAVRDGRKLAQVLLERRWVAETDLRRVLEAHIDSLLAATLEWPDGTSEFASGRPNLEGEVSVRVSPVVALLRYARRFPERIEEVRMRIGPPDGRPKTILERAPLLNGLDLGATAQYLLARCDGSMLVHEVAAESPGEPEETLRTLYALTLMGAIRSARAEVVPTDGTVVALDREECLAILAKTDGADSYAVLGLSRQASTDAVRASYYALARRYHPDRFRSGRLQDLLPRIEQFFTRVTEAYNTLSNPELRAEYDASFTSAVPDAESARQSDNSYLARQNYARGKALLDKRRYAEAATFLENAAKLDTTQAAYQLEFGLVLTRNPRRRGDAEKHLIQAANLEPTSVVAYLALGQMYERSGRLAHAARAYREALRWDPEHAEASSLLAGVAGKEGSEPVDFLQPVFGE